MTFIGLLSLSASSSQVTLASNWVVVAGADGLAPDSSGGAGLDAAATGLAAGTAIGLPQPVHFTRLPAYCPGTFSFFLQAGQETSIGSAIVEPRERNPGAAALNAAAAITILEA